MVFYINLPINTKVYRSSNAVSDLSGKWFSLDPKYTYGYGSITREFKINKDVKLLNLESDEFYNDYIKQLNQLSKTNTIIKERKNVALFPLGYLDYDVYKRYAISIMPSLIIQPPVLDIDTYTQFTGNRSRLSEYRLDELLVHILHIIYGNTYDGIIALEPLPNRIFGKLQYSELCIFNVNNRDYISEIPQVQSGGDNHTVNMITAQYIESPYIDKLVSDVNEYMKTHKSLIETDLPEPPYHIGGSKKSLGHKRITRKKTVKR